MTGHVVDLMEQRDRARDWAVALEQENARLAEENTALKQLFSIEVLPVRLCFVCGMDLPHEPTAEGWKCSQCGAVGGGS